MFAKDYRRQAWGRLSGNWGVAILAYLLYSLIIGALSTTGIGSLILAGPLYAGLIAVFVQLARTGSTKIEGMFENLTKGFVNKMLTYILVQVYTFLWALLFIIPGIVKGYSYSMAFYIMNDNPEMGANEAITRSREMMNGHKWQLFCLHFSFIGWILLSILTFGILTIFVAPYMQAAEAEFYENLKLEAGLAQVAPTAEESTDSTEFI
ncbi:MAG: DUF975 family protein [Ruminococcaceae bacterium]|nr:DUF975 family protein [Oscillospiraceae bacterium]